MKTIAMIIIVSLLSLPMPIYAQQTGISAVWQKIGETRANLKMESGSIVISVPDKFRSLKLKTDAAISLISLEAYYGSGEVEEIFVAGNLNAGATTEEIPLKGCNKQLKKVVFTYKNIPNARRNAHVELFGSK